MLRRLGRPVAAVALLGCVSALFPSARAAFGAASGAYETQLPISVPAYYGLEPKLQLVYDSQAGNGLAGVGWNLTGFSVIERMSDLGGAPTFEDSDVFSLDGMKLVRCTPTVPSVSCLYPSASNRQLYASFVETDRRIELDPAARTWHVWEKNGTQATYEPDLYRFPGYSEEAVQRWRINRVEDTSGHEVRYTYLHPRGGLGQDLDVSYPLLVTYGRTTPSAFSGTAVRFYYQSRPDAITAATGDALSVQNLRLKTIDVRTAGRRHRAYALRYLQSPETSSSLLRQLREYGADAVLNAAGTVVSGTSLPPVAVRYQAEQPPASRYTGLVTNAGAAPQWNGSLPKSVFPHQEMVIETDDLPLFRLPLHTGDFDGDGRTDGALVLFTGELGRELRVHYVVQFADGIKIRTSLGFPVDDLNDLHSWAGDINDDGRADLIFVVWQRNSQRSGADFSAQILGAISDGKGGFYFSPASPQATSWVTPELLGPVAPRCQPGDVDGDGKDDLVCTYHDRDGQHFLATARSRGDGTFDVAPQPQLFASGRGPRPMAVGNANADGLADVFIADLRPTELDACPVDDPSCVVHFDLLTAESRGDGRFDLKRTRSAWRARTAEPALVVAQPYTADVNGDGRADYVDLGGVTFDDDGMPTGDSIRMALSRRDGSYAFREQPIPPGITREPGGPPDRVLPNIFTFGDANGDGRADLLLATPLAPGTAGCSSAINYRHPLLTRGLSNGEGFELPAAPLNGCDRSEEMAARWSMLSQVSDVQPADTNGDGLADFLLGFYHQVDRTIHAFTLHDSVSRATGLDGHRWFPADVSGDGREDLLYISSQQDRVYVHTLRRLPNGSYAFTVRDIDQSPNPALGNWKVMDVDGNGRADLVRVRCRRAALLFPLCTTEVDTLLSNGDGTWTQKPRIEDTWLGAQLQSPPWRQLDVNGDGRTDLVQLSYVRPASGMQPGLYLKTYLADGAGGWTAQPVRGPLEAPGDDTQAWRPIDVDGDGRTDLVRVASRRISAGEVEIVVTSLLARGVSEWVRQRYTRSSRLASDGWIDLAAVTDTRNWHALDVNGDGKTDLVHLARTQAGLRIHTLFSQGTNFGAQEVRNIDLDQDARTTLLDLEHWIAADPNGDGRADLQHISRSEAVVEVESLLSTGDGGWRRHTTPPLTDPGTAGTRRSPTWQASNFNGDAKTDLLRVDVAPAAGTSELRVHVSTLRSNAHVDVVTRVRNSIGGLVTVRYAPSSQYGVSDPGHGCSLPLGVVARVVAVLKVSDGRHGRPDTTRYGYACAHWSQEHRRFLGWTDVSASRDAARNRPAGTIRTRYRQTDECLTQLHDVGYLDEAGAFVAGREIVAYNEPGSSPPYNCLPLYRNRIEYGSSAVALNAYAYFAYDAFGNLRDVFELGAAAIAGDERTTGYTYHHATQPWIVGLPWQQTISQGAQPTGRLLRSTFFCYDGDNGSDTVNCSHPPTKGRLTGEQLVDGLGLYVTTTYEYDAYGNLAATKNPRHIGTANFFDTNYHRYVEAVTNALGHTTSFKWDLELGRLEKVTDPNGAETEYRYDEFGRVKRMTSAGGRTVRREYLDWGNPKRQRIRERLNDGSPDGLWMEIYIDGLGRVYRVVKEGDRPGERFVQRTAYSDASPLAYGQWHWHRSGAEPPRSETFDYDLAGRLVRQTHPDGSSVRHRYDADGESTSVTTINERGHAKTVSRDAYGRVTKVVEREAESAQVASVTYTYDAADELLTQTDPNGNVTTNTWDMLGQLRRVDDPDLGPRTYTYDLNGNRKTQTDAKNRTIMFTYDLLDRPETKTYPGAGTAQVTWRYDEPGHGASKGRLTSVVDPSGTGCAQGRSQELSYDQAGQITSSTKCVEGRAYTTMTGYDRLGRQKWLTYPDGETVTYEYDAAGRLARMPGYADALRYNAAGQLRRISYANGTEAHFTYDAAREWLDTATVSRGTTGLYNARYRYELNGLVRSIASTTDKMNVVLTHDELDRLREVTGDLRESFRYDAAGNLQYSSALGTYAYPRQGPNGCTVSGTPHPCAEPHAPTQAGGLLLDYDANGDLRSVTDPARNKSRGIDWNDDHRPLGQNDFDGVETFYGYDAAGERVSRRRGFEHDRYYGPYVEHSSTRGLIKNYYAGSMLVARREGGSTRWYHGDHLGSVRLVTDASGLTVARYEYTTFGNRTASGTTADDIGFTGRRTDAENASVEMGARDYAPWLGQFTSPDTVTPDPLNTQALNRYAYAYDSPASYIDPTGHGPWISEKLSAISEWFFGPIGLRNPIPLTTVRLREIARAQSIGAPVQSGPLFNRAVGRSFQEFVLRSLGLTENFQVFTSPAAPRVVPEAVAPISMAYFGGSVAAWYPNSSFYEIKAVNRVLTLSYRKGQIRGLIEAAANSAAGRATTPHAPPPRVTFITTGDTKIGSDIIAEATARGVAIWHGVVLEEAGAPVSGPTLLGVGAIFPLNPQVYELRAPPGAGNVTLPEPPWLLTGTLAPPTGATSLMHPDPVELK
jgi:RHS repeat-associated protein